MGKGRSKYCKYCNPSPPITICSSLLSFHVLLNREILRTRSGWKGGVKELELSSKGNSKDVCIHQQAHAYTNMWHRRCNIFLTLPIIPFHLKCYSVSALLLKEMNGKQLCLYTGTYIHLKEIFHPEIIQRISQKRLGFLSRVKK